LKQQPRVRFGPEIENMRMADGHYECVQCGDVLNISHDAVPRIVMKAASGRPNERAIVLDGHEIHSCPMPSVTQPGSARG
jgi:hypothetical protein